MIMVKHALILESSQWRARGGQKSIKECVTSFMDDPSLSKLYFELLIYLTLTPLRAPSYFFSHRDGSLPPFLLPSEHTPRQIRRGQGDVCKKGRYEVWIARDYLKCIVMLKNCIYLKNMYSSAKLIHLLSRLCVEKHL